MEIRVDRRAKGFSGRCSGDLRRDKAEGKRKQSWSDSEQMMKHG